MVTRKAFKNTTSIERILTDRGNCRIEIDILNTQKAKHIVGDGGNLRADIQLYGQVHIHISAVGEYTLYRSIRRREIAFIIDLNDISTAIDIGQRRVVEGTIFSVIKNTLVRITYLKRSIAIRNNQGLQIRTIIESIIVKTSAIAKSFFITFFLSLAGYDPDINIIITENSPDVNIISK